MSLCKFEILREIIKITIYTAILATNNAIDEFSAPYIKLYLMPFYIFNFTFSSVIFGRDRIIKFRLFVVAYEFIQLCSKFLIFFNCSPAIENVNTIFYVNLSHCYVIFR